MNISLITAFRERVEVLERMIQSVESTVDDINNIEILIAIDDDDTAALNYVKENKRPFLKHLVCKRAEHFTKYYMNPLARMAQGRWIITINDDVLFKTKNWDSSVIEKMDSASKKYNDDILLGLVKDGMHRPGEDELFPHFSSFPVISKEAVNALGYIFNERFYIWGVDHFVADVYRRLNRLVSLTKDVFIEHISHHNRMREKTEQERINFDRFCAIETKHGFSIEYDMVEEEASKFIEYLKNKHGQDYSINMGPLTKF